MEAIWTVYPVSFYLKTLSSYFGYYSSVAL